jgi:hypothetical protein
VKKHFVVVIMNFLLVKKTRVVIFLLADQQERERNHSNVNQGNVGGGLKREAGYQYGYTCLGLRLEREKVAADESGSDYLICIFYIHIHFFRCGAERSGADITHLRLQMWFFRMLEMVKSRIIHACVQLLTVINNFKTTLYGSQIMKMVFIVKNDTSQLTSNKNYHQVVVYGLY